MAWAPLKERLKFCRPIVLEYLILLRLVETFHEAVILAVNCPTITEQAQYSTFFPVAVALARGDITLEDISGSPVT